MLDGLYSAAAGMEAQQEQIDALANDVSNVSTPGYQSTRVDFHDLLYTSGGPAATGTTVATGAGSAANIVGRSQVEGALQPTGRSLDVAILGEGYLEVRRPDGTIGLTRNGSLQVDGQGRLTTDTGLLLQPPLRIPAGTSTESLKIAPNGVVRSGSRVLGRISLVTVPAPDRLLADGDGVFSATAASGGVRGAVGATLQQGALEGSNVDLSSTMGQMIDAQRGYAMASKAIEMQDQMLQIANQVKR
jgi:flagellar basal-body rod protein FlgG